THSRAGVMPNWTDRLTDAQIKQAAIYVHSLGGGQ
ncbi:MAG: cytochrome C oxidase Cbb3, partial [Pseudomonadota bacterium]